MNKNTDFSVNDAIKIQQEQLQRWSTVLKPDIYNELKRLIDAKTARERSGYKSGHDVFRGTDIEQAIVNWFIYKNTFNQ